MTDEYIQPYIESTDDGSHTLRHPLLKDSYHSLRGAVGESEHVFIRNGLALCEKPLVRILEIGFGSGLNALLSFKHIQESGQKAEYHTVELYPVAMDIVKQLNYTVTGEPGHDAFITMHKSPWGKLNSVTEGFSLKKYRTSLLDMDFDTTFDVIYFDAFSPDTQPELWSEEIFRKLYKHTSPGGVLATYSSKGDVKRALRAAGYEVKRLEGALGKRHMLTARKNL